jgi:ATP-dependent protease HslVU (ClpYQ) peptidase subunit
MAADTRVSYECGAFYHADKIFRIGESLFGTAGDGMMCLLAIEWLRSKSRKRPELYANWTEHTDRAAIQILEINPDGIFIWDGWGIAEKINDERAAVGSGSSSALAAYDSGKTLEESVGIAAKLDLYTGPPIQVEYLIPEELRPSRKKR